MKKSNSGAITVYLSIILSSVILLSGILMDIVRIKAAEIQVRRAVDTSVESALAGYNSNLKEDYGLFALHSSDSSKLEGIIGGYLSKNLLAETEKTDGSSAAYSFLKNIVVDDKYKDVHFIDLYDYKIENVEVVPLLNFSENEISRQQIAEYMKYRAPVQFAENFIEKVNFASSTADLTDAYKQKTAIEKKMAKVEKALLRLQEDIDKLNKFEKDKFDNKRGSGSLVESYIEYAIQQSVYEVYGSVYIEVSDNEEDWKKAEKLKEYATELYDRASKNAGIAMEQLSEHTVECLMAAQNASQEVDSIKVILNSLRGDIDSLKNTIKELEKNNTADKPQIAAAMKQDIAKWEQLIESENSSSISETLREDTLLLNDIRNNLAELPGLVDSYSTSLRSQARNNMRNAISNGGKLDISGTSELEEVVLKVLSAPSVKNLSSSAKRFEAIKEVFIDSTHKRGKDPRKTIADGAKEIKDDASKTSNPPKRIEEPKLLPSYYANGSYPNKIFSDGLLSSIESMDNANDGVAGYVVDFQEESNFSEDTFGYITDFATKLGQYAKSMRDEIYVNEYILKTFKDEVEIKDSGTDNKLRDTLFDKDEVEYILAGQLSETQNSIITRGKILLIRFGMNTLYVYSDPQKRIKALEIATAVAGFTGFGIPVVHNLIMCAWGMAEALQDISDLYQGKKVPFIKTAQSWHTDLVPGGYTVDEKGENQGSLMDFDYHDYLRLLLLVENKEVKMNRIEDLVQLNMQKSNPEFKLNGCNTYMKVNVQVSMRYWFLTKVFIPSKHKTSDGRHLIDIEAWKGY